MVFWAPNLPRRVQVPKYDGIEPYKWPYKDRFGTQHLCILVLDPLEVLVLEAGSSGSALPSAICMTYSKTRKGLKKLWISPDYNPIHDQPELYVT